MCTTVKDATPTELCTIPYHCAHLGHRDWQLKIAHQGIKQPLWLACIGVNLTAFNQVWAIQIQTSPRFDFKWFLFFYSVNIMARSREQGRKPKAKKEGGKSKKTKAREVKRNLKQVSRTYVTQNVLGSGSLFSCRFSILIKKYRIQFL